MRFPNLVWAVAQQRMAHYQLALAVNMGESRFSRAVNGRIEFSPEQREKITQVLGYPETWLFREVVPPKPVNREHAADRVSVQA